MGKVVASATVSLDGFIAYPDDTVGSLFDWFDSGDVEVSNHGDLPPFHLTKASADFWQGWRSDLGCLVVGRRLFDITDGWHGTHPLGVPIVVVTHEPPTAWSYPGSEDFHFVTDGIEAAVAVAQEIAGERTVGAAAGTIAGQLLGAGLLDRVSLDLVPVVLGRGKRYFGDEPLETMLFGDPLQVVQGHRVTHLLYDIQRGELAAT
jgi:dihydrofolate reductase